MKRSRFTLVHVIAKDSRRATAVKILHAKSTTQLAPIENPGLKKKRGKKAQKASKSLGKAATKKYKVSGGIKVVRAAKGDLIKRAEGRATEHMKVGSPTPKSDPRSSTPRRGIARAERVGIWDLGAWLGGLPSFLERCNAAQTAFVFYSVKATVPPGTVRQPKGIVAWHRAATGARINAVDHRDLEANVIADDFFPLANVVRKDLELDYIIGVTPSLVAGTEADAVYWNYFSTCTGRAILASTHDLREFAKATNRSFEVYLGTVVLAQLLVACNSRLDFHTDRGCLFDYNKNRVGLQAKVSDLYIEPACLNRIATRYRMAAHALTEVLRTWEKP